MSPRRGAGPDEAGRFRRRAVFAGVGILVLTATVSAFFGDRGYLEVRRYQSRRTDLLQEIHALEEEVRQIHREIISLRQDPQAMERLAREELILARPGEIVFLYPRDDAGEDADPGSAASTARAASRTSSD